MKDLQEIVGDALALRANRDHKKLEPNRQSRRRLARQKMEQNHGVGGLLSRVPSSVRTGNPPWWDDMKREAIARRHMGRVPCGDLKSVAARAKLADALAEAGLNTVYDLATVDYARLLKVPGTGPATLRKIRTELIERQVPVKWEVPA